MLSGIQKSLRETQYTLVTLMEPRNEADIEKFLQSIKTIRPNGIIYSFYYGDSMIVDELKNLRFLLFFLMQNRRIMNLILLQVRILRVHIVLLNLQS